MSANERAIHSVPRQANASKIRASLFIAVSGLSVFGIGTSNAGSVGFDPIFSGMILSESSATWGDYDNDGDLDVLSPNALPGVTDIYRNDAGVFVDMAVELGEIREPSAAWGDYDNDGDLDILLAGDEDFLSLPISRVYRNEGGTFIDINAGLAGVREGSVAWGDFDNDGDLDILLTGELDSGEYTSKVYRNDNGSFVDIAAGLTGVSTSSASWGDYDNDLDLDILLTGLAEPVIPFGGDETGLPFSTVYRNDNGTFVDIAPGLTSAERSSATWGDYDGDGDLDIALAGEMESSRITQIYRNDAGVFTDIGGGMTGITSCVVAWGDHDNDGDLDLLVTGSADSGFLSRLYVNDAGTFTSFISLPGVDSGNYRASAAWGDFDNDGDLDILFSGGNTDVTDVFRNDSTSPNVAPTPPATLFPVLAAGATTFGWDAASDDTTPASGLSYHLRLGITPGGQELFSGMANTTSGYRRVPAIGNANHNPAWTWAGPEVLALLQDSEILYWSVQSVDAAFAGSTPAPEREYSARPHATSVSDVGGDQGQQVRLQWERSAFDLPVTGHLPITGYSVWRRVEPGSATRGGVNQAGKIERRNVGSEIWDYVLTVPARASMNYAVVAPTLCDSTEAGICYSTFIISAMTPDPTVYYDSVPDSGYSVDNLAPGVPTNLILEASLLEWDESDEEDFRNFSVYGSDSAVFDETALFISHTVVPTLDISGETAPYFHVTASDFSGNEGEAASVDAVATVPGDDTGDMTRFALSSPQPNPTSGQSVIHFALPRTEVVDLNIFDISGRLVSTLLAGEEVSAGTHDVAWDGSHLVSGVYFVRMEAGEFSETRRLHLSR